MASIKQRRNVWYAVWYSNGKQVTRTTGIPVKGPKEKKLAQNTADTMEQAANGNITVTSAVDALRKVAETLGMGKQMPIVRDYLTEYKPNGKESNERNYKRAVNVFLKSIDVAGYKRLDMLDMNTCRNFLLGQLKRVSYGTVKHYKAMIDAALNQAVREGIIDRNPMAMVSLPKLIPEGTKRATERVPFTMEEMRTIINTFPYPWRELALTSYLTGGQRLGDIATLKWSNIDFDKKIVAIRTAKTGKVISAPLSPMLEICLKPLKKDENQVYVFPGAAQKYMRSKGSLSVEFTTLLKSAGIIELTRETTTGDRRPISPKSFHSIRHTVVSQMRCNPALTPDLVREIVGHESEEIERGYFTAPTQAKLDAMDFLQKQLTPASAS
jgi:integrase